MLLVFALGVHMYLTASGNLYSNTWLYRAMSFVINRIRSVSFVDLLITVLPLTALLTGTALCEVDRRADRIRPSHGRCSGSGDLVVRYAYQRFHSDVMVVTVVRH